MILLLLAGVLVIAVWYLPLIKTNERMRKEILRRDTQIQKEEEISRQLKPPLTQCATTLNPSNAWPARNWATPNG